MSGSWRGILAVKLKNAMIDKENKEAVFYGKRAGIVFCWRTDMLEILPLVRLCYGYNDGIFEREVSFQLYWLVFSASFSVKV